MSLDWKKYQANLHLILSAFFLRLYRSISDEDKLKLFQTHIKDTNARKPTVFAVHASVFELYKEDDKILKVNVIFTHNFFADLRPQTRRFIDKFNETTNRRKYLFSLSTQKPVFPTRFFITLKN